MKPTANTSKTQAATLTSIKESLSAGLPAMFGFRVFESIQDANNGKIPFPEPSESVIGGHAVLCIGYDDNLKIGNSVGAFIIRNSWGEEWGERGYGYLPYDYLISGLAEDWWVLATHFFAIAKKVPLFPQEKVEAKWTDPEQFGV